MKNVAVIGVGQTKFGELWDKSLRDIIVEAGNAAIVDSSVDRADIGSLFIGSMSSGRFAGQEHLGALACDHLSLNNIPATRCEGACASGSIAFRNAYHSVALGDSDISIVLGAEKMTELSTPMTVSTLALAGDQEWEESIGLTFAGLYALIARAHMHKYGTTKEQLANVSVNNHKNAVGNRYAQYPFDVSLEKVMNASMIADPLGLLDCSGITDGAAAVVIANEDIAKKCSNPVWVLGSGQGSDTLALHDRVSITEMAATKYAAKKAFEQAGLASSDMDMIEVHDCFSINEIISLEDLGFCEKGSAGRFIENNEIGLKGSIPTNTTGGLKACGHAVGATGLRQIGDVVKQLRGTSHNQVNGAKRGLNLNIGGSGATSVVNIFGSELG